MSRSRYTYRRPWRTEYNPDYYSRDYNARYNADYNAEYNADYNTEYNAISVSKLHDLEYSRIRSRLRLGDPELHNYDDN